MSMPVAVISQQNMETATRKTSRMQVKYSERITMPACESDVKACMCFNKHRGKVTRL